MSTESISVTRTIPATPEQVYALLTDPTRHHETEPGDWVRDAVDPERLTRVDQVFAVRMFLEEQGGDYTMHNRVSVLEQDRSVAWRPGFIEEDGTRTEGGHEWRYDLEPEGDGTRVRLSYEWSAMPQEVRDDIPGGMPAVPESFLDDSLAALEQALARQP